MADPAIPNLFIVDQTINVWRGGQPESLGWDWLKAEGVSRIVKLNTEGEGSDDYAAQLGLDVFRFPIPWWRQTFFRPSQRLLFQAVGSIAPGTFVHCGSDARTATGLPEKGDGGEDRTGLIVGCFRLSQGWSKADAYEEMKAHGFHDELQGLTGRWSTQTEAMWQEWAKQRESVAS